MTNLKWLEEMKNDDEKDPPTINYIYRQAKAIEIIAEEIINLNRKIGDIGNHIINYGLKK